MPWVTVVAVGVGTRVEPGRWSTRRLRQSSSSIKPRTIVRVPGMTGSAMTIASGTIALTAFWRREIGRYRCPSRRPTSRPLGRPRTGPQRELHRWRRFPILTAAIEVMALVDDLRRIGDPVDVDDGEVEEEHGDRHDGGR